MSLKNFKRVKQTTVAVLTTAIVLTYGFSAQVDAQNRGTRDNTRDRESFVQWLSRNWRDPFSSERENTESNREPRATRPPRQTVRPTNIRPTDPGSTPRPTDVPGDDGGYETGLPIPPAGVDIPECPEDVHDSRAWHGIYNPDYGDNGCHFDHEHKMNPHDLDHVFGTEIYDWAGGELSYPWQTYHGAYDSFEAYIPGTATENTGKHEGYAWLHYSDRTDQEHVKGALLLGSHVITDARVQYHQIGGEKGALTRFHSVWLEARACFNGEVNDNGVVNDTCGTYQGGAWLDLGRLNHPKRGDYAPLPGDPVDAFSATAAEKEPYRIHAEGKGSLDSWQSERNRYNYLASDPNGDYRLSVGYGIHFPDSPGETNPDNFGKMDAKPHFWCLDEETGKFTCDFNSSQAAFFRTWVEIPKHLDGSEYDLDGEQNGYFSFNGYTNRYGDIANNCTEVGLDCIPAVADHFPIGGCSHPSGICKAAYRGGLEGDLFDGDVAPAGENWIEYPN